MEDREQGFQQLLDRAFSEIEPSLMQIEPSLRFSRPPTTCSTQKYEEMHRLLEILSAPATSSNNELFSIWNLTIHPYKGHEHTVYKNVHSDWLLCLNAELCGWYESNTNEVEENYKSRRPWWTFEYHLCTFHSIQPTFSSCLALAPREP